MAGMGQHFRNGARIASGKENSGNKSGEPDKFEQLCRSDCRAADPPAVTRICGPHRVPKRRIWYNVVQRMQRHRDVNGAWPDRI